MKLSFFSVLLLAGHLCVAAPMPLPESNDGARHVFSTNQENFLMDGKPIKIISGEMHYPRVPRQHWKDRFQRIKAMGMNTVCTYLFWNVHEPEPGKWDFSGNLDFVEFIKEAQKAGLWVIVRPGPYVCAEWEFGGFPGWLLKDEDLKVRSQDPRFLEPAMAYLKKVCSMLEPLQITKGGPIIMAQVENEYGSYGSDKDYVKKHLDVIRKELPGVVPFTSDGPNDWMIKNGTLPGVVPAMNFGGGAKGAFANLEKHKGKTPRINGEFWVGWFDHWGEEHHTRGSDSVSDEIKAFLDIDASFNFYMFHGGTNFGFTAGANYYDEYQPTVTSYDYCALLTEWGDYTPAYYAVREILLKAQNLPETELPASPELQNIGKVALGESTSIMSNLDNLGERRRVPLPESMEYFGQNSGMIYYETKLEQIYNPHSLRVAHVHDTAYVYIDGEPKAKIDRRDENKIKGYDTFDFDGCTDGCTIGVLVDAMGRVNYGEHIYDRKGIEAIRYGNQNLMGYDVITLPLDNPEKIDFSLADSRYPLFMRGHFKAQGQKDCFTFRRLQKGLRLHKRLQYRPLLGDRSAARALHPRSPAQGRERDNRTRA